MTITGARSRSTTIQAPAVLQPLVIGPVPGRANVVEVFGGATVTDAGPGCFRPAGTDGPGPAGVSVQDGATLRLEACAFRGCTSDGGVRRLPVVHPRRP
ncbi:MAG: hypothetical protein ACRD2W_16035 [Acidimicrobiales bacterium]